ncbi:DNA replication licensing factor MCM8 [Babesia bigemina]|uniref:DNA replication licensing factor MCM8 n=1 Tax=Babesia bigemina TaxID=5866 RepID=A0A061D1E7_BABBI|nr:DNA replication licensing factor MCM8 [Babesia bigemina]CDR94463.1 DNA replication licensing factor MCM8 [Babesia bigemina]|eukprot:XP_012766649.1 DNA replication licensing factor MCM8 [Babesia bigemina]
MELSAGVLRHLGYLYFTGDQTKDTGPLIKGITQWTEYFDFNWQAILGKGEEAFRETYVVHIDYLDLLNTDVPGGVEVFKHNICSKPAFLLSCMSAGLHISACKRFGRNSLIDKHLDGRNAGGDVSDTSASSVSLDAAGATDMQCKRSDIATTLLGNGLCKHVFFMDVLPQYVTLRLQNFFPRSPFSVLRSHAIGCLVSIAGQVIRISTTTPMIISGMFTCAKCGCHFFKKFKDGLFEYPSRCFTEGCTWRASHFQRHCVQTTSSQVVRIQEDSRMDTSASARYGDSAVGTYVDVELTGDLVDQCSPGNLVDIVGIVDATPCLVNEDLTGHNSTYNIVVKAVSMNVLNKRMTRFSQDAYGARGFRWGITNGIPDHQMNSRKTWKGLPTSAQTQDTNSVASQDDNATGDSGLYNFIREIYYSEPNRFYLAAASLCRAAVGRPYIKGVV